MAREAYREATGSVAWGYGQAYQAPFIYLGKYCTYQDVRIRAHPGTKGSWTPKERDGGSAVLLVSTLTIPASVPI